MKGSIDFGTWYLGTWNTRQEKRLKEKQKLGYKDDSTYCTRLCWHTTFPKSSYEPHQHIHTHEESSQIITRWGFSFPGGIKVSNL